MSLDLMNLLLVFAAALAGGWIARRLGYPSILGELTAGIVLGPPILGLLAPSDSLAVIGKLGVILLMLYIGLHLDASTLTKVARPGFLAATGGFIVPAGLGFGLMMLLDGDPIAATFVAVAMGVTSLATKSRILVDLNILNTRVAHVLLAGALISDVAALVVFSVILGLAATGTVIASSVATTVVQAALFLAGAWLIGTKVFPLAGRWIAQRKIDSGALFMIIVAVGLAFGAAADAAGLHAILGAFLAGLFIREGVLNHDQLIDIESRTKSVSLGLLAPVFFVTAGFDVSFSIFTENLGLLIGIVVLATLGKIFGTALFYLPTGFGFREGVAVGAGMNGRGAVEIIVAELALAAGIITAEVFSILVFMAIFTTATVPIFLTRSIAWLRRHDQLETDDRENFLFVGAGPVARQMAALLSEQAPVTLIDTNLEHCRLAEDAGLRVVKGTALDLDVLIEAGIRDTRTLIASTANPEINLLAGRLAHRRFGVPDVHIVLSEDATQTMISMLDEFDGSLLFGRPVDIAPWDVDVSQGRTVELHYSASEVGSEPTQVPSLPLFVHPPEQDSSLSIANVPTEGDAVIALARIPVTGLSAQATEETSTTLV